MIAVLVDGEAGDRIAVDDRAVAYGDGLFETLRVWAGAPVLLEPHLQRLRLGCERLGMPVPTAGLLEGEAARLCADCPDGVLRITWTRGRGARGYRAGSQAPTRIVALHPPPPPSAPLRIDLLESRLAVQPALAGIKHLNRLEQVLAASECAARGLDEGLLRDIDGRLVCGVTANLFVVAKGRLLTPTVDRCGIAGVLRGWLLQHAGAEVAELDGALADAEELFLCNSVRGILPVARCGRRELAAGPVTRRSMDALHRFSAAYPSPDRGTT